MKAPSDKLYQLIKNLSASQKGYFKKYAGLNQQKAETGYLKLFEAIDKLKEYDEDVLRKKLRGEKFLLQLSVAKNYLYDLILSSLEQYHADPEYDLLSDYKQAGILAGMGLKDQALDLIKRSVEKARATEKFAVLALLLRLQWKIAFLSQETGNEFSNETLYKELYECLKQLENTYTFHLQYAQVYDASQKYGVSTEESHLQRMKELLYKENVLTETDAMNATALSSFYKSMSTFFFAIANHQQYYEYNKKQTELIEQNLKIFNPSARFLVSMYGNTAGSCMALGLHDEMMMWIKKLDNIETANAADEQFKWENKWQLKLTGITFSNRFAEGSKLIKEFKQEFSGREIKNQSVRILLPAAMANIEAGAGEYKEALHWLNFVLNENELSLREDVESEARILELIVHFELENHDMIEYKIRSVYRYLLNKKRLHATETTLLKFMRKIISARDKGELINVFEELLIALEESKKERGNHFSLRFDLKAWLKSKISGKSYEEIKNFMALSS